MLRVFIDLMVLDIFVLLLVVSGDFEVFICYAVAWAQPVDCNDQITIVTCVLSLMVVCVLSQVSELIDDLLLRVIFAYFNLLESEHVLEEVDCDLAFVFKSSRMLGASHEDDGD